MKHEIEIKLQAWLDGELSAPEAAEVKRRVAADPDAASLLTELRQTREALRAGEVERVVPESREFYWSKLQRAITAQEPKPSRPEAVPWQRWLRVLLPLGAAAAVALLLSVPTSRTGSTAVAAEIENHLDDMGSFSFRSESEGMTVIWIASN
jgi:anti-sigma factor RsiW